MILGLVLLGAVVAVISAPLRAAPRRKRGATGAALTPAPDRGASPVRDELEAARESKYREIRDAELDFRTGKLSREDFEAIDGELRVEAIEILDRLQALDARDDSGPGADPGAGT